MAVTDASEEAPWAFPHSSSKRATPGFRPGKKENKLGLRASDTSEVVFTDCQVPAENLLGKEGEGFVNTPADPGRRRISIAALGLGMAQGAYEGSVRLCQTAQTIRQSHRGISGHPIQARRHGHRDRSGALLTYRAAWLADRDAEGNYDARFTKESSMAKLYAGEVASG